MKQGPSFGGTVGGGSLFLVSVFVIEVFSVGDMGFFALAGGCIYCLGGCCGGFGKQKEVKYWSA